MTPCNDSHENNSSEPSGRTLRHAFGKKKKKQKTRRRTKTKKQNTNNKTRRETKNLPSRLLLFLEQVRIPFLRPNPPHSRVRVNPGRPAAGRTRPGPPAPRGAGHQAKPHANWEPEGEGGLGGEICSAKSSQLFVA